MAARRRYCSAVTTLFEKGCKMPKIPSRVGTQVWAEESIMEARMVKRPIKYTQPLPATQRNISLLCFSVSEHEEQFSLQSLFVCCKCAWRLVHTGPTVGHLKRLGRLGRVWSYPIQHAKSEGVCIWGSVPLIGCVLLEHNQVFTCFSTQLFCRTGEKRGNGVVRWMQLAVGLSLGGV